MVAESHFHKDTLILSQSQIKKLVNISDAIECMEQMFKEDGLGQTKNFTYNFCSLSNTYSVKLGSITTLGISAVKSFGLVVLSHDSRPRQPLAIFQEAPITYLRTGAAGAVAAKHLMSARPRKICILGAGKQARAQLEGLVAIFESFDEIAVWSRSFEHAAVFSEEMRLKKGWVVHAFKDVKEAAKGADLVVTVTRATQPLIDKQDIDNGIHINAMGADSPGAQELSEGLLQESIVVADNIEQATWMGASNVAIKNLGSNFKFFASLGQIVAGVKTINRETVRNTVFDCSGLGMMDAYFAYRIYQKALSESGVLKVDLQG